MSSLSMPVQPLEARLAPVWRVEVSVSGVKAKPEKQPGPAAQMAQQVQEENQQQNQADQEPGVLQIHVDAEAGRFVNVLLDPHSQEVLRQYPNEGQLAYARAVNQYLRALK